MVTWRSGQVVSQGATWGAARELQVALERPLPRMIPDGDTVTPDVTSANAATTAATSDTPQTVKALAYTALVGDPHVGDTVLLNCSALARGLGTGGYALVVAPGANNLPPDPAPGPGHLVKARYTPLQALVLGVDEQESAHHRFFEHAEDVGAMPCVVADLHSALPAIIAGARYLAALAGRQPPRVAYVMTDGGA
ncbi:MAG: DUF3866 family protein, partial [Cellulomonadaceae bacterium]|nr:DUF3866 family protein [Cellulomonadaceae bacterium]